MLVEEVETVVLGKENREAWLTAAVARLWPLLVTAGAEVPPEGVPVRVSVGWPNRTPRKTIGQCHDSNFAADGVSHVFVSPLLSHPVDVLGTLLHELIHASDNGKSGHKGYFKKVAVAAGLTGKMTATSVGEDLHPHLLEIANELGAYPHGGLTLAVKSGAGSRLLKGECPECGYTVRLTKKWVEVGMPTCPCGTEMEQV